MLVCATCHTQTTKTLPTVISRTLCTTKTWLPAAYEVNHHIKKITFFFSPLKSFLEAAKLNYSASKPKTVPVNIPHFDFSRPVRTPSILVFSTLIVWGFFSKICQNKGKLTSINFSLWLAILKQAENALLILKFTFEI